MAEGDIAEIVGGFSKLVGLSTIVYGLAIQDMETIAGGAALVYAGRTFTSDWFKNRNESIELQRNKIFLCQF